MKIALILCFMFLAGAVGYFLEPSLRPHLTGYSSDGSSRQNGNGPGDDPNAIDLASLTPEQLPKVITIMKDTQFEDAGITSVIKAGSSAELIEVNGDSVVVTPNNRNFRIELPISGTNLIALIKANPPQVSPPVVTTTPPATTTPTTPTPPRDSDPVATVPTPGTTDTPPATPTPTPQPTPTVPTPPVATPSTTPLKTVDAAAVISAMKDSIANKQISEFSSDQVIDWKAGGVENLEGVEYQTGTAFFTVKTPFGKKTMEAKALLNNGKVERWIWPFTGVELD